MVIPLSEFEIRDILYQLGYGFAARPGGLLQVFSGQTSLFTAKPLHVLVWLIVTEQVGRHSQ